MRATFVVGALALAVGCAPAQAPLSSDDKNDASRVVAFERAEDEILRDLAAIDRRIARRARIVPREDDLERVAMAGILADDPTLAVVEGAIDPFSFDARGRGLAAAKKKIAALPARLPSVAQGMTPTPALERDLLARLVDEEILRLEEERGLPRSASALVRAIVETWAPPKNADDVPARDRWLARRLDEVRAALEAGTLDVVRARELDDALDALEHLVDAPGYREATQQLLHVREALEAQGTRKAARAASEWAEIVRKLRGHLGVTRSPEEIDAALDAAEKEAAANARAAAERARIGVDELARRSSAVLFADVDCINAVPGSRVRSMAAPLERRALCNLTHAVANAQTDADLAVAFASLHDHIVVAQWALDVARGTVAVGEATARHHLLKPPGVDQAARLERIALARPIEAIGAGIVAATLVRAADPAALARRLTDVGEVPLDVADATVRPAAPP